MVSTASDDTPVQEPSEHRPFQTKIFPLAPLSRMKQSSRTSSSFPKGLFSPTLVTVMEPVASDTCPVGRETHSQLDAQRRVLELLAIFVASLNCLVVFTVFHKPLVWLEYLVILKVVWMITHSPIFKVSYSWDTIYTVYKSATLSVQQEGLFFLF